tara:strand:+ start:10545 stop:11450 length:906 start_codon:yes stop_codon:yes gene_type:complete
MKKTKCGYVSIIGKPNVGKSTIVNRLLDRKVSITSKKAQTTRNNIMGVKTNDMNQIIFLDTPGIHSQATKTLNKVLNKSALSVVEDSDLLMFVLQRSQFNQDDQKVLDAIQKSNKPTICIINKIDQVNNKNSILPFIEKLSQSFNFKEFIPISALKNEGMQELETMIYKLLPENPHMFPEDSLEDLKNENFFISEIVREKLIRILGDELPYEIYVDVEKNVTDKDIQNIGVVIYVAKKSQKSMVIGQNGDVLKRIGTEARTDLEKYFSKKVMLKSWVKIKKNWSDDLEHINSLGIGGNKNA